MDLVKVRSTICLFVSMRIFKIEEQTDIRTYPTIKAYVPINFGKKKIDKTSRAEEIT